jgi:hypothetical protein
MIALLLIFAAVSSCVFFVLLLAHELNSRLQIERRPKLQVGDVVVYRKLKVSTCPSPRAYDIHPADQGDSYQYFIDKYWTIEQVFRDGRGVAITRTHKHHCLSPGDPNLRKAGLIIRLRYRKRFPDLEAAA